MWDIIILVLLLTQRSLMKSKGIWNFISINKQFLQTPVFVGGIKERKPENNNIIIQENIEQNQNEEVNNPIQINQPQNVQNEVQNEVQNNQINNQPNIENNQQNNVNN